MYGQVIVTVAGTGGVGGYSGDGGPATNAKMAIPFALAFDNKGSFYFSDDANARVRKVTNSGVISLFCGTGSPGNSGDGGLAIHARIGFVTGIASDSSGNVYLADGGNSCVRRVTPDGIITTIAGTGVAGYNGDGIPATDAQLSNPQSIAVDDTGNLYICDRNNYRIRKVLRSGTIQTIIGTGSNGFSADGALADTSAIAESYCVIVDHSGNILFKDGNRIRKINCANRIIETIAGNGVNGYSGDGGAANFASIATVQFTSDSAGNLFLSEQGENRLRKVNNSGQISTFAGTGAVGIDGDGVPIATAKISAPTGIAFSAVGELFFADASARIRKITLAWDGVNEVGGAHDRLELYPNPAHGVVNVRMNTPAKEANLTILDASGVVVKSMTVPCNVAAAVDVGGLLPGMYLLKVAVGGEVFCRELMVR